MTNIISRAICCDIIMIVSDYNRLIEILTKQAGQPHWVRHTIVAVLNMSATDEQLLNSWYYEARMKLVMPNVVMIRPKVETRKSVPAMQNAGLLVGNNPFVYFHSEKDDLPLNIDRAIFRLYHNQNLKACVGRCEVYLTDGTPLENFPALNSDEHFQYGCYEATRLFPSYIDPFSTVFRKTAFEEFKFFEPELDFQEFAYYHFMLKMLERSSSNVEFLTYTIKKAKRSKDQGGLISSGLRERLINDIKVWLPEHQDDEYKEFQIDILTLLENNDIVTFKEIDARIEDYLDRKEKYKDLA